MIHLKVMTHPRQIAAGRALIGMQQQELARRAKVPLRTLKRIEARAEALGAAAIETVRRLQAALERAGVRFLEIPAGSIAGEPGALIGVVFLADDDAWQVTDREMRLLKNARGGANRSPLRAARAKPKAGRAPTSKRPRAKAKQKRARRRTS
jgi:hypothetical protein